MTEAKQSAALTRDKCERLLGNADFIWFLEEAVLNPLAAKDAELKDTKTDRDAREIAAHVREALETVAHFTASRRDVSERLTK